MNQKRVTKTRDGSGPRSAGMRPAVKWVVAVLAILCLAALAWHFRGGPGAASTGAETNDITVAGSEDFAETNAPEQAAAAGLRKTVAVRAPSTASTNTWGDPTEASQRLLTSICDLGQQTNAITAASAAVWKQQLRELIQQGPAAIPAIREFMAKNTDIGFGPEAENLLGFSSARAAFVDALAQIGGPEGIAACLEILQSTGEPHEIGVLARNLENLAPGQYRDQVMAAAKGSLEMGRNGQLQGYDVAPLFEILQRYGGTEAIPEIERSTAQWKYYSSMALAQMPDGAGIPTLVSMTMNAPAVTPLSPRDAALEMLAQVAIQYPEARQALISQVQSNRVPAASWTFMYSILGGDQAQLRNAVLDAQLPRRDDPALRTIHLSRGNQNLVYAPPPGGYSPDQLGQQLALVEDLRQVTTDPNALNVLRQAQMRLEERLKLLAGVPGK